MYEYLKKKEEYYRNDLETSFKKMIHDAGIFHDYNLGVEYYLKEFTEILDHSGYFGLALSDSYQVITRNKLHKNLIVGDFSHYAFGALFCLKALLAKYKVEKSWNKDAYKPYIFIITTQLPSDFTNYEDMKKNRGLKYFKIATSYQNSMAEIIAENREILMIRRHILVKPDGASQNEKGIYKFLKCKSELEKISIIQGKHGEERNPKVVEWITNQHTIHKSDGYLNAYYNIVSKINEESDENPFIHDETSIADFIGFGYYKRGQSNLQDDCRWQFGLSTNLGKDPYSGMILKFWDSRDFTDDFKLFGKSCNLKFANEFFPQFQNGDAISETEEIQFSNTFKLSKRETLESLWNVEKETKYFIKIAKSMRD